MTRTSKRLTARAAARQRQAKANEDQRHREHTELEHATEFEVARLRRDDAAATVITHELVMARQIHTLLALGNSVARVVELTGESEAEIRRLRRLTNDMASQDVRPSAESPAADDPNTAEHRLANRSHRSRTAPGGPTVEPIRAERVATSSTADAPAAP